MLAALLAAFSLIAGASGDLEKLASVVAQLFSLGNNSNNEAQQVNQIQKSLQLQSAEIAQYSAQILAAQSQLDKRVFENAMSQILANADASAIALAEWSQNPDAGQQAQALNASEQAVASIVEEYAVNTYPGTSMVIVLARAALARMAALGIFPGERTPSDYTQLHGAWQTIVSNTGDLDQQLVAANQIHTTSSQYWVKDPYPGPHQPPGHWVYVVKVTYSNVTGDIVYNNQASGETPSAAHNEASSFVSAATELQTKGLAEDRNRAQVPQLEVMAQNIDQGLTQFPQ